MNGVAKWLAPAALVAMLAGCTGGSLVDSGEVGADGDNAPAVWELASERRLDDSATSFTVLVSRLGCNSGVTGTVNSPTIVLFETEVVVTFSVSPGEPEIADCRGNDQIPYEVTLPEPLGERVLIDGACEKGGGLVVCESRGIRYSP